MVNSFKGALVVFTGSLFTMTRSEALHAVERYGGKVAASVSERTTFVVAGPGAGSKLRSAEQYGIPVIDETAFIERLKEADIDG